MSATPVIEEVIITANSARRLRSGHRWIFANDVTTPVKALPVGGVCRIVSDSGQFIGYAHTNPNTLIAGRLLTEQDEPPTRNWFFRKLESANQRRVELFETPIYRMVYSEGDGLPGLTIDRYDRYFVVQIGTAGMEAWREWIVEWLQATFHTDAIYFRNDSSYRSLEGLSTASELAVGTLPARFRWNDRGVICFADLSSGQKTGSFLDQRFNRYELDRFSTGSNVLDLFCHTGSFGIRAAVRGAASVTFVDASELALELTREAALENGVIDRCTFLAADIFEWIASWRDHYRIIICDPPALIKKRSTIAAGIRGYEGLNRRAMERVERGGYLFTFSCSHHLSREQFRDTIRKASRGGSWRILSELRQAPDHPILLNHPETEYLKGALLQRSER